MGEFISGWAYWLSAWLEQLAFAAMLIGDRDLYSGLQGGSNLPSIIVAIIFCWVGLLVNGVENASFVNTIGTFCRLCRDYVCNHLHRFLQGRDVHR